MIHVREESWDHISEEWRYRWEFSVNQDSTLPSITHGEKEPCVGKRHLPVTEFDVVNIISFEIMLANLPTGVHLGGFDTLPFLHRLEHWIRCVRVFLGVTDSVPVLQVKFLIRKGLPEYGRI
jgi:hypothetical protein